MAGLKAYYDLMSPPSRAVYLFLKLNNISYVDKPVALRKGEHYSPEYTKLNPFQRVPIIDDNGFVLTESVAILKYLATKYGNHDHWYPSNLQLRAKVDEYLAWQHTNTREKSAAVFRLQVVEPRRKNIPIDQEKLRRYKAELETTLDHIENVFLRDRAYLCGDDLTIADLIGVCELYQPYAAGQDLREGRAVLGGWISRVKERLQPHFDEAHQVVYRVREKYLESKA